jgi:hypothetical protein
MITGHGSKGLGTPAFGKGKLDFKNQNSFSNVPTTIASQPLHKDLTIRSALVSTFNAALRDQVIPD